MTWTGSKLNRYHQNTWQVESKCHVRAIGMGYSAILEMVFKEREELLRLQIGRVFHLDRSSFGDDLLGGVRAGDSREAGVLKGATAESGICDALFGSRPMLTFHHFSTSATSRLKAATSSEDMAGFCEGREGIEGEWMWAFRVRGSSGI